MTELDATHDQRRTSWVASANGHADFPIQNLPFGSYSPPGGARRIGVAIGDQILLDLAATSQLGWLDGIVATGIAVQPTLNALMALGAPARRALRARLSALLDAAGTERAVVEPQLRRLLTRADACAVHLPADIGDYTDFYAGIRHATNAGAMRSPANPLHENYKHIPIAYHGRASSVRPSGYTSRRPHGQRRGAAGPTFGPTELLDYEAELAIWIGPGNAQGEPIAIAQASQHIWGYGLLNDLSARDIQRWETVPLGPFLGKSFATVVSPWIVTPEALAPFRIAHRPRPDGDPRPLDYLWDGADQTTGMLDIEYEVFLLTPAMRRSGTAPQRISAVRVAELYWTPAQMVAHHTSGGCNLLPGDLFGTGTISGSTPDSVGSLMERSANGTQRISLPGGETRLYLEDGDEVTFAAHCGGGGRTSIGFGTCRAIIGPAGN